MYQGNYNKKPRTYAGNSKGYSSQKMNYFTEIKNLKRKNYMADADRSWKHSLVRNFLFIAASYFLVASLFYVNKMYILAESGVNDMLYAAAIPTALFVVCSLFILIIRRLWINFVFNSRSRKNHNFKNEQHNSNTETHHDEPETSEDDDSKKAE